MLHPTGSPATLTNRTERKSEAVKPTAPAATTTQPVQPQPEQKAETVSAPAPQPVAQGCESYIPTFRLYNWSVDMAVAICKAESGGNTSALSSTGDRGLMQINWIHSDMVGGNLNALYDPSTNISVAYRIYSARGWTAWSTYLNGSYLHYQ